jgi:hypothetical protein
MDVIASPRDTVNEAGPSGSDEMVRCRGRPVTGKAGVGSTNRRRLVVRFRFWPCICEDKGGQLQVKPMVLLRCAR